MVVLTLESGATSVTSGYQSYTGVSAIDDVLNTEGTWSHSSSSGSWQNVLVDRTISMSDLQKTILDEDLFHHGLSAGLSHVLAQSIEDGMSVGLGTPLDSLDDFTGLIEDVNEVLKEMGTSVSFATGKFTQSFEDYSLTLDLSAKVLYDSIDAFQDISGKSVEDLFKDIKNNGLTFDLDNDQKPETHLQKANFSKWNKYRKSNVYSFR